MCNSINCICTGEVLKCGFGMTDAGNPDCTFYYDSNVATFRWMVHSGRITFSGPSTDHTRDMSGKHSDRTGNIWMNKRINPVALSGPIRDHTGNMPGMIIELVTFGP